MPHNYSSALSHFVVAGITLYCLRKYSSDVGKFSFSHGMYLLVMVYSLMGIWRWGNPGHGIRAVKFYNLLSFLQSRLTLPIFTTEIWLRYCNQKHVAYFHCILSLLPLLLYSFKRSLNDNLSLKINIVNCFSLAVVSFIFNNYWGVTAAISYFLAFFIVKERLQDIEVPNQDLFNYGLSFFIYFTRCALQER